MIFACCPTFKSIKLHFSPFIRFMFTIPPLMQIKCYFINFIFNFIIL